MKNQTSKQSSPFKRVHFIGIGGSGMLPLAHMAIALGHRVTGSDLQSSEQLKKLEKKAAKIYSSHHEDNIAHCDLIVISSAIKNNNIELLAAKKQSLQIMHRSEFLQFLTKGKKTIAVAGTHGKSTTSAMITHILEYAGYSPLSVVGGHMLNYDQSWLHGKGEYFVIEADESDGSFLNYTPFLSVITNIDNDHLDHYGNFDQILNSFSKFISNTVDDGSIVINWDDRNLAQLTQDIEIDRLAFGKSIGSDIRLLKYEIKEAKTKLDVMVERDRLKIHLPLIGYHNVLNALSAITAARTLEVDNKAIIAALESFKGVNRRLTNIYQSIEHKLAIFDDYAHNPSKIEASIAAIAEAYPDRKIFTIFEPHRYSRLQTMYNEFISCFTESHYVAVLPIYAAGEPKDNSINEKSLAKDIGNASATKVYSFDKFPTPKQILDTHNPDHTIYLTVGAGICNQLAYQLRDVLNETQSKLNDSF